MVCPECGAEYREGFTRCHDCEVDLVVASATAPQEASSAEGLALVPALRVYEPTLLPVIESLLSSSDIPYFVQGDEAMGLFPLGAAAAAANRNRLSAVIHVPADRLDELEEYLEEFEDDRVELVSDDDEEA